MTDRAQAVVLLDRRNSRLLRPFMVGDRSVTEAAADLDTTAAFLLPRVRRFERLGLLRVVGLRRRKGRPIKVYRAVGTEFFVPFSTLELDDFLLHEQPLTDLLVGSIIELMQSYASYLPDPGYRIGSTDTAVRLSTAIDERVPIDLRNPVVPPVMHEWRWPRLPAERAKALQIELIDLIDRATTESETGHDAYVVSVRMAPVGKRVDDSVID